MQTLESICLHVVSFYCWTLKVQYKILKAAVAAAYCVLDVKEIVLGLY